MIESIAITIGTCIALFTSLSALRPTRQVNPFYV